MQLVVEEGNLHVLLLHHVGDVVQQRLLAVGRLGVEKLWGKGEKAA